MALGPTPRREALMPVVSTLLERQEPTGTWAQRDVRRAMFIRCCLSSVPLRPPTWTSLLFNKYGLFIRP